MIGQIAGVIRNKWKDETMGIKLSDIILDDTLPESVRQSAIGESLTLGSVNDMQDLIGASASPEALPLIRDVVAKKMRDMPASNVPYLGGATIDEVHNRSRRI